MAKHPATLWLFIAVTLLFLFGSAATATKAETLGKLPSRNLSIEENIDRIIRDSEGISERIQALEKGFSHLSTDEKRIQNLKTGLDGMKGILRTLIDEVKKIEKDQAERKQKRLRSLAVF